MKKFISVCLVASMVASMGVTAFADDNNYKAKDKDLEFHKELLYDGRGADELWLPIVVKDGNKKHFVTDGRKTAYEVALEMLDVYNDAAAKSAAITAVIADMKGQAFADVAEAESWVKEEMKNAGVPVYEISKQDIDGSEFDLAGFLTEVEKTYTMNNFLVGGNNKNEGTYKSLMLNSEQVIEMLGYEINADATDVVEAGGDILEPIDVDEIEDANDVEIKWKAKRGGNLVADVYIDEVSDLGGLTCVVFELTDHLGIAVQYIDGELKMESGKNRELDEQDIRYNYYGKAAYSVAEYAQTVGDINNGYEVNGTDNYINLVDFNQKFHYVFFKKNVDWVELEDNQGFYYEVDVAEQGKINLVYNNEAIDAVTDIASTDAVLAFYNFEARPTFDFSGKVTLTPPDEFFEEKSIEELYLYTYEKDGSLKPVKQAKVGEDGDTLEFRTATLGKYVLSTEELTLLSDAERATLEAMKEAEANGETVEPVVEDAAVVVDENKANPGTGC